MLGNPSLKVQSDFEIGKIKTRSGAEANYKYLHLINRKLL